MTDTATGGTTTRTVTYFKTETRETGEVRCAEEGTSTTRTTRRILVTPANNTGVVSVNDNTKGIAVALTSIGNKLYTGIGSRFGLATIAEYDTENVLTDVFTVDDDSVTAVNYRQLLGFDSTSGFAGRRLRRPIEDVADYFVFGPSEGNVYEVRIPNRLVDRVSRLTAVTNTSGAMTYNGNGNALYAYRASFNDVASYDTTSVGRFTQNQSVRLVPDNSATIGLTYDEATDTLYALDASWQSFAYDISRLSTGFLIARFNESRSFNYHRSATETRTPIDHERFDDGFRLLLSDGTIRKQLVL